MPLVSVIIPIYNTEKFLPLCINSVLNQTLTDIEVLLVNDGSTDGSGKICDEYACKDQRIQVIHTLSQGVSHARNQGLETAKGEYIAFMDSDDWIETIIRKSKFPQNPKRSVRFLGKGTKRSVQKRKARNTQKAETKVL